MVFLAILCFSLAIAGGVLELAMHSRRFRRAFRRLGKRWGIAL